MDIKEIINYLKEYDGPPLKLMEVCGTHTAAIFKGGIRTLISPKIRLISGPGCPVCVTPTAYIDACIHEAMKENTVLATFGDMMKVPGKKESLTSAAGLGARVEIMYSPFDVLEKAKSNPQITYVIAAVGFETTAPIYGLLLEEAQKAGIENIRLITAIKRVIPALEWICENQPSIDGFICPGHVSVITGTGIYQELAEKYGKPFVVAGFEPELILAAIYDIIRSIHSGVVHNLYKSAVREAGNARALAVIDKYFEPGSAVWRGLGMMEDSGLYLRREFARYDMGSRGLDADKKLPAGCRCKEVITGTSDPVECPMFGKECSPERPFGPCMVSGEGACGIWYRGVQV